MPVATTIAIVRPEHLSAVRKRLADAAFVAVYSETEWLGVQDIALAQPPDMVIMQLAFAATSRGATLVSALKAKSREHGTTIRVFLEDETHTPILLADAALPAIDALLETSRPLDRAGTRQAVRFSMNRRAITINGDAAELLDLSVSGAQVQAAARLRPMKVARVVLFDDGAVTKIRGTVAWAIAVPEQGSIVYRGGVEFVNPDKMQIVTFCARHGGVTDPTRST